MPSTLAVVFRFGVRHIETVGILVLGSAESSTCSETDAASERSRDHRIAETVALSASHDQALL